MPFWIMPVDPAGFDVLRIPEAAQKTIDDQAFLALSDDVKINPLDSHRLLCQLKVAAALMALDRRYREITDEDWELAETVMEKSTQTRNLIQSKISEKTEIVNVAKGKAEGNRAYVAEETQVRSRRETSFQQNHRISRGRGNRRIVVCRSAKKVPQPLPRYFDNGRNVACGKLGLNRK